MKHHFQAKRRFFPLLIAFSIALLATGTLIAEISPTAYTHMQNTAGERLTIHVSKVTLTPQPNNRTSVVAEATVKEVKKSASGVKSGDALTIRYDITPLPKGFVGPAAIPPLEEGKDYPAYMTKEKDGFTPAARAYSFTKVGDPLTQLEAPTTNPPATNAPTTEPKKPKKPSQPKPLGSSPTNTEKKLRPRIEVVD